MSTINPGIALEKINAETKKRELHVKNLEIIKDHLEKNFDQNIIDYLTENGLTYEQKKAIAIKVLRSHEYEMKKIWEWF